MYELYLMYAFCELPLQRLVHLLHMILLLGRTKKGLFPWTKYLYFNFFLFKYHILSKNLTSLIFLHPFTQMGSSNFSKGILNYYIAVQ